MPTSSSERVVVGIDSGSRKLGLACVRQKGSRTEPVDGFLLNVKGSKPGEKLQFIYRSVGDYLDQWHPDSVSIEDVFSRVNVKTTVVLSRIAGILLLLCEDRGVPVTLYPPAKIKAAVTGNGNATKEQVSYIVRNVLKISASLPEDVADAYAAAMCHLLLTRELFSG